jgi:hypothetical protein
LSDITDDDPSEPARGYYRALGRFIHRFSQVERVMITAAHHFAGLESPVAQAVMFGFRVDACKDVINRILDANGDIATAARLKSAFDQLGVINSARNNIIHWGAFATADDTLIAINDFLAHTPERVRSIGVSVDMLDRMQDDLARIQMLILWETVEDKSANVWSRFLEKVVKPQRGRPWRYKQPQPAPHVKERQDRLRAQKRQRGASPKSPKER